MGKKIWIVLCALLSMIVALLLWHEKKIENEKNAIYREMSAKTRPLSLQADELEQQISDLEKEAAAAKTGTATTQFLVTDLSVKSYERVISPLADYGYPVGLAISLSELPGAEDCLTGKEAQDLAELGWYFCYAWEAEEAAELWMEAGSAAEASVNASNLAETLTDEEAAEALGLWLSAVEAAATAQGLEMGTAIYFPSGSFREGFAEMLISHGIQTVIHDGELGAGRLDAGEEEGLWYAGSAWWRNNEVLSVKLSAIAADGGELVTRMGVDGSAADTLDDWMKRFENIVSGQNIEVTEFSGMIHIQTENASRKTGETDGFETQIAELEAELEDLEAQIEEIENGYLEQIRSLER